MVDDNSLGLQARKAVLEELGYRVTTAGSAEDALEQLAGQIQFDILITDYKLPGKTGRELIADVRGLKISTSTVLLSGFVEAMGLNEDNTGADIVLQKSSNEISHLLRSVKSLLKRARRPPGSDSGSTPPPTKKKA